MNVYACLQFYAQTNPYGSLVERFFLTLIKDCSNKRYIPLQKKGS